LEDFLVEDFEEDLEAVLLCAGEALFFLVEDFREEEREEEREVEALLGFPGDFLRAGEELFLELDRVFLPGEADLEFDLVGLFAGERPRLEDLVAFAALLGLPLALAAGEGEGDFEGAFLVRDDFLVGLLEAVFFLGGMMKR